MIMSADPPPGFKLQLQYPPDEIGRGAGEAMLSMTASCAVPASRDGLYTVICNANMEARHGSPNSPNGARRARTTFPGTCGEGAARPRTSAHHSFSFRLLLLVLMTSCGARRTYGTSTWEARG